MQSQGFRPSLCGMIQTLQSAAIALHGAAQEVLAFVRPIQDFIDPIQDRLYSLIKDIRFVQEFQREGKERPWESLVLSVVADIVVDAASFVLGHDILTGEKLSHGMELVTFAAIFVPLVAASALRHGDNVARAGSQLSHHADELGEVGQMATRHSDELLDDFYAQARALNFPDRVTDAIVANLKPGRKILIELSELSDGSLGLKRAARFFDDQYAYKHIDLKGTKSNDFGLLYDEDYVPHLSDPDIMGIIDDGRILSDEAALKVVDELNFVARGNRGVDPTKAIQRGPLIVEPTDPFQHSQRATFFTVNDSGKYVQIDPNTGQRVRIADSVPNDGVAVFELNSNGSPIVYTVGGGDEYVGWVTKAAYNEDLSYFPWAGKHPGGNPSLTWDDWYRWNKSPNRIYSARELVRRVEEPGPFHNFPGSFDETIFKGRRMVISDNYVLYTHRGTINGYSGTFEIGVRPSPSGRTEIIRHRFFRRDR